MKHYEKTINFPRGYVYYVHVFLSFLSRTRCVCVCVCICAMSVSADAHSSVFHPAKKKKRWHIVSNLHGPCTCFSIKYLSIWLMIILLGSRTVHSFMLYWYGWENLVWILFYSVKFFFQANLKNDYQHHIRFSWRKFIFNSFFRTLMMNEPSKIPIIGYFKLKYGVLNLL